MTDQSILNATLAMLSTRNKSKVLSNPRVSTIDNKEARIQIGEKIPYRTTTLTAQGSVQSTSFVDVGIQLYVIPTINADKRITLTVKPIVSQLVSMLAEGPRIATREAETTVVVKNGDTIVIGGLIKEQEWATIEQVPLLGDIPILGYIFKHKRETKDRIELLVFLTPTIIEE